MSAGAANAETAGSNDAQELLSSPPKTLLPVLLKGDLAEVKHLLEGKADANERFGPFKCFRPFDSGSPLVIAVLKKNTAMVDLLLQHKGDLDKSTYSFMAGPPENPVKWEGTPIFAALPAGDVQFVSSLVDRKADPHRLSLNKAAPIWNACYFGHVRVLEYLMEKRADLENKGESQEDKRLEYTPLHVAARNGRLECVRVLLEASANIEGSCPVKLPDSNGALQDFYITPLDDAIESGHTDVVKLLMESKANFIVKDDTKGKSKIIAPSKPGTPAVTRERYALEAMFAGKNTRVVSTVAEGLQECPEQMELLRVEDVVRFLRTPGDAPVKILEALFAQKDIKYWQKPRHELEAEAQQHARTNFIPRQHHCRARQSEIMNSKTSRRTFVTAALLRRITVYGAKRFMINVAEGPSARVIDEKHAKREDAPPDILALIALIAPQPHNKQGLLDGWRDELYVQITCHMSLLPDIHRSPEVLMAIAAASNPEVYDMAQCEAIVNQSWDSVWKLHIIETAAHGVTSFLYAGIVACLRDVEGDIRRRRITILALVALPLTVANAVTKMAQVIGSYKLGRIAMDCRRFSFDMFLHGLRIASTTGMLLYIILRSNSAEALNDVGFRVCLALELMQRWVFFFTLVRLINADLNVIIDPIVGSIVRSLPFVVATMAFVFVAFQCYWCLNVAGMDDPFEAFLVVFRLCSLNDFNQDELEGLDGPLQLDNSSGIWTANGLDPSERPNYFYIRFFIIICGFTFPVMLMNILIGVLGVWLDYSIQNVWKTFQSQRILLVLDYMALKRVFHCHRRRLHREGEEHEHKPPSHVWYGALKDDNGLELSVSPLVAPAMGRIAELERHILRSDVKLSEVLEAAKRVRRQVDGGSEASEKMQHLHDVMKNVVHVSSKLHGLQKAMTGEASAATAWNESSSDSD